MRTDQFDYHLPTELIAQTPVPRGASRLLVLHRSNGHIEHRMFPDLLHYLNAGDTLVLNNTRVTARRLEALRESGLPAEVFLLRPRDEMCWEALVRPGRGLRPGKSVRFIHSATGAVLSAQITAITPEGGRILEFVDRSARDSIATWGATPLPPYIGTALPPEEEERYQTVYAAHGGSAAAPTAGLHFTSDFLNQVRGAGVATATVTLHVGLDTFRPVKVDTIEAHHMHGETAHLTEETANQINRTHGKVVAVGTTCVRTLETAGAAAARTSPDNLAGESPKRVLPYSGETHLFITPGYRFQATDAILTNFHLPRSTLLMLVSAFAGSENIMRAYLEAIEHKYRFFSFGDAMFIV